MAARIHVHDKTKIKFMLTYFVYFCKSQFIDISKKCIEKTCGDRSPSVLYCEYLNLVFI